MAYFATSMKAEPPLSGGAVAILVIPAQAESHDNLYAFTRDSRLRGNDRMQQRRLIREHHRFFL